MKTVITISTIFLCLIVLKNATAQNVGIGINSSINKAKLMVRGGVNDVVATFGDTTSGISLEQNSPTIGFNSYKALSRTTMMAGYGGALKYDAVNGSFLLTGSNNSLAAGTAYGEGYLVTIDKFGQMAVGGGITTPLNTLHVNGGVRVLNLSGSGIGLVTSTANGDMARVNFPNDNTKVLRGDGTFGALVGGGGYWSFNNTGSHIYNNNVGNVGIGTISPANKFTVAVNGNGITQQDGTGNLKMGFYTNGGMALIQTYTKHDLNFSTNNNTTPQITLDTAGNVGIGTTTPNYILDINGRARLRYNGAFATAGIWYNNSTNAEAAFLGMVNDTTIGVYGNGNWRIGMDFKKAAIGIGTTTPFAALHISSVNREKILLEEPVTLALNTKSNLYFKNGNYYTGGIGTTGNDANHARMGFYTYADPNSNSLLERMSITDAGNVGIGTISPTSKLEVTGSIKINDGTQGEGKVLTSDATGVGAWRPQSFGNVERFQFLLQRPVSLITSFSTTYNYGTAAATSFLGSSPYFDINITKAGLYHFNINFSQVTNANHSPSGSLPDVIGIKYGSSIYMDAMIPYIAVGTSTSVSSYEKSYEVYIGSGGKFHIELIGLKASTVYYLSVTGHLIAE